jgi:hypothetical protein
MPKRKQVQKLPLRTNGRDAKAKISAVAAKAAKLVADTKAKQMQMPPFIAADTRAKAEAKAEAKAKPH